MHTFQSIDPATGAVVWEGAAANPAEVGTALARARSALAGWATRPLDERIAIVRAYGEQLKARAADLAALLQGAAQVLALQPQLPALAVGGRVAHQLAQPLQQRVVLRADVQRVAHGWRGPPASITARTGA